MCQAKIQELRHELLRSSENNIFALLNMPISSHVAESKEFTQVHQEYNRIVTENKLIKEELGEYKIKLQRAC